MSDHAYLSTACHHGNHPVCRFQCKFCAKQCSCSCHSEIERSTKPVRTYQQLVEENTKREGEVRQLEEKLLSMKTMMTAEELTVGRILRGHTKIGCVCRYCKSVLSGRIVLHEG